MKILRNELELVIQRVREAADDLEETAGQNGAHTDYGANELRSEVDYYMLGFMGELPKDWEVYYKAIKNELDPEWKTFLRLKDKFK